MEKFKPASGPKLELVGNQTKEEMQAEMNKVADELANLSSSMKGVEQEYKSNPTPQLASEIAISKNNIAELQSKLQYLLDIEEKGGFSKNNQSETGPWNDINANGRNGIGRR